jgi:hypothetical protein
MIWLMLWRVGVEESRGCHPALHSVTPPEFFKVATASRRVRRSYPFKRPRWTARRAIRALGGDDALGEVSLPTAARQGPKFEEPNSKRMRSSAPRLATQEFRHVRGGFSRPRSNARIIQPQLRLFVGFSPWSRCPPRFQTLSRMRANVSHKSSAARTSDLPRAQAVCQPPRMPGCAHEWPDARTDRRVARTGSQDCRPGAGMSA